MAQQVGTLVWHRSYNPNLILGLFKVAGESCPLTYTHIVKCACPSLSVPLTTQALVQSEALLQCWSPSICPLTSSYFNSLKLKRVRLGLEFVTRNQGFYEPELWED